jgi:1L-myo-inositol 1-phosphate cytidylyltransferase / CDP-L-myo-inositol myo-inositolphosphotransferase
MISDPAASELSSVAGLDAQLPLPNGGCVEAVILAAGEGSRLGRSSKPLAEVAGLTLLERTVASVRTAGITRVVVVVGHAKEAVAEFVSRRGLDVELVTNDRFSIGNGSSAVAGGQVVGERFLLMMCDHLVEPDAIARMVASTGAFAAAVDTCPSYCDIDDATKVRVRDGAVVAVARDLDAWDAVDAGIFVCDRSVVETAEHALAAGEGTWNAVKRRWIMQGRRLEAVDLTGCFWIDVDTPGDARRAEKLIVTRAASKPRDGVVSRRLNRPLSRSISLLLIRGGASPNAVTAASFALTLVAATAVGMGSRSSVALVAGGLLVQLASVVDGCDGEVARATLCASSHGAFLDSVLDRVGDVVLLAALAGAAGAGTATWTALAAALVGCLFVPYVKAAFEATARTSFPTSRLSFGRDARMLAIAICAVALQPLAGLVAVAALSAVEAVTRSGIAVRTLRRQATERRGA